MLDTFPWVLLVKTLKWHDETDPSRCLFFSPELACFVDNFGAAWHCAGYVDTRTMQKLFQAARQLGGYHVRASEKESSLGNGYYPVWIARDGARKDNSAIWEAVREMESQIVET